MADIYKGITVKIGADTTELDKALKGVNKQASETSKELKQVEAGLKLDPKNTELLRQKMVLTDRAIQSANSKLGILNQALKEMNENGVDKNSKEYMLVQRDIQKTTSKIKKLNGESAKTNKQTKEANKNVNVLTKATELLGSKAVLVSTAIVRTITKVITSLVNLTTQVAKTSSEILSLSSVTRLSSDQLQEISYVSNMVGVSASTYQNALSQVNKEIEGAMQNNSMFASNFEYLSVAFKDAEGNARDSSEVFYDVIDALSKVEDVTKREEIANELLGSSYDELAPLIKAGSNELRKLSEEAYLNGFIIDEESLKQLKELNNSLEKLYSNIQGVKNVIASGLSPSVKSFVDELNSYFDQISEKGVKSLFNIEQASNSLKLTIQDSLNGIVNGSWSHDAEVKIINFFSSTQKKIEVFFEELWKIISNWFQGIWSKVIDLGSQFGSWFSKGFFKVAEETINWLVNAYNNTIGLVFGSLNNVDYSSKYMTSTTPSVSKEVGQAIEQSFSSSQNNEVVVSVNFEGNLAQIGEVLEPVVSASSTRKGRSLVTIAR